MTAMPAAESAAAVERPCPVCGSREHAPFAEERIDAGQVTAFTYASRKEPEFMCLRLVRCHGCDLVYAPTPPAADYLTTAYSEAAYDSSEEARFAAESYAKALTRHLSALPARGAAVDVGAGSGPLLPWLKAQGFAPVIGIEPSVAAIAAAPPEVVPMLRQGMFSASLLGEVRASLVCSFMTLEHISDPGSFVQNVFDVLEPGGMIAVVVHDWRAPLNRLLGLRSPIIDVEHLQLFSPRSLQRLLAGAGFGDIDQRAISNTYPLRYWLRLTPLPAGLKSSVAALVERSHLADLPLPMRVGNRLAVGYKPLGQQQ
jgi:SAM-dependent methyltransferase